MEYDTTYTNIKIYTPIKFTNYGSSEFDPKKTHDTDSGYDLYLVKKISENPLTGVEMWDTGIAFDMPEGVCAYVYPRSSMCKSGYTLANNVGVIDNGYHGTIKVAIRKFARNMLGLSTFHSHRLVQIVFDKVLTTGLTKVDKKQFSISTREDGGFGSTGE